MIDFLPGIGFPTVPLMNAEDVRSSEGSTYNGYNISTCTNSYKVIDTGIGEPQLGSLAGYKINHYNHENIKYVPHCFATALEPTCLWPLESLDNVTNLA